MHLGSGLQFTEDNRRGASLLYIFKRGNVHTGPYHYEDTGDPSTYGSRLAKSLESTKRGRRFNLFSSFPVSSKGYGVFSITRLKGNCLVHYSLIKEI
ncbi:hypothetical protein HYP99_gp089 [Sinorhizobium phage ort11]|uniref:Uncharacterized protein n=1 Tax=Sinorhizobium phage ort11 TaxID=2599764 RepID=A0A5C2H1E7_9CAUD|nr:hypothetical protein HYP99_gp089 [Sinorhizobium phage ort11]QEP29887.1 hypothetical protein Smphiort11_089 [Sinorhizobium phage ort11]